MKRWRCSTFIVALTWAIDLTINTWESCNSEKQKSGRLTATIHIIVNLVQHITTLRRTRLSWNIGTAREEQLHLINCWRRLSSLLPVLSIKQVTFTLTFFKCNHPFAVPNSQLKDEEEQQHRLRRWKTWFSSTQSFQPRLSLSHPSPDKSPAHFHFHSHTCFLHRWA